MEPHRHTDDDSLRLYFNLIAVYEIRICRLVLRLGVAESPLALRRSDLDLFIPATYHTNMTSAGVLVLIH